MIRLFRRTILLAILACLFIAPGLTRAQTVSSSPSSSPPSTAAADTTGIVAPSQYFHGRVTKILEEGTINLGDTTAPYQVVDVQLLDDPSHKTVKIEHGRDYSIRPQQKVKVGDEVIVSGNGDQYYIVDTYRIPWLIIWSIFLFVLILIFARSRGAKAILGLFVSLLVLIKFIVPQIILGHSPALVSLVGALVITTVALVLAHGRNRRTLIAIVATLITLALAVFIGSAAVNTSHLFGLGSEEAYSLLFGPLQNLNFQGLLLGGLLIGAVGILDDITTAQAAVVDELKRADPSLGFSELFRRGTSVGREHIASLVNTLLLAYAGVSLPLFLVFNLQQVQQPFWVIMNSEMLAEEIIRTIVGSATLVLAVPITTALAAYAFGELGWKGPAAEEGAVAHHH